MKRIRPLRRHLPMEHTPFYLVVLSICFFTGILAGHTVSHGISADSSTELYRYLSDYFQSDMQATSASFWSALLLYYRYPTLAFLFGFSSIGMIGLPLLSAAFGFFSSFSSGCFVSAFGQSGVLLALAAFGFRCFLTLICYYLIAVPAFKTAAELTLVSFGRVRRITSVPDYSDSFFRVFFCSAILFVGVLIECYIIPHILKLACTYIFI